MILRPLKPHRSDLPFPSTPFLRSAIARIGKRRATGRRPRRDSRYASGRGIGDHVDGLIEARGNQIVVARIPDVAMAALIIGTPLSAIEKASFERQQEIGRAPV